MSLLARHCRWASRFRNVRHCHTKPTPSPATPPAAPPIQVGVTESAGRGVFASRRIGAGELIHTAQPIVSHPSLACLASVCYFCLKRIGSSSEAGSETVSFCSEQCEERSKSFRSVEEKADWSRFYEHCQMQGLKYPLLAKRLACQAICGTVSPDVLEILQPEISSAEWISQMKREVALLRGTLEDTDIESEKMAFLTEEWYMAVLARIRINAFRIELAGGSYEDMLASAAALVEAEAEAAVGNAVYLLPSLYNHDCDPNVNIVWVKNVDAKVNALRDIEEGEELRICYIDASMEYEARQSFLYHGFGFQCKCSRCLNKD